jgi:hypothetical protein
MAKILYLISFFAVLFSVYVGYLFIDFPNEKAVSLNLIDVTKFSNNNFERDYWVIESNSQMKINPLISTLNVSGCIAIKFTINSIGQAVHFETHRELSGNLIKREFAESIKKWKWKKSNTNPDNMPIRTMRIFSFGDNLSRVNYCYE